MYPNLFSHERTQRSHKGFLSYLCSFVATTSALLLAMPPPASAQEVRRLRVADDHRHLEYTDGKPFFYLGDTAWLLFSRLNREESERYLANRAAKGFTVIQAVALAPDGGVTNPNANGDLPLIDRDPARPNEAYFKHVDDVVRFANQSGLVMGLLPSWGNYWKQSPDNKERLFTPANARAFGEFLGKRYRHDAIIWVLGGDNDIASPEERAVVDALAAGLRAGDGGAHLITFHPRGPGRSSDSLRDAAWLDFNMYQSSHGAHDHDNGLFAERDYALTPPKPTLDGEPRYEQMPVGFYYSEVSRLDRFDDYDVRQAAYWSVLAGACGHTYGNNNIWYFWRPGIRPAIYQNQSWQDSLDTPGAFQMGIMRRLFESRDFNQLEPAPGMVVDAPRNGAAKVRGMVARDRSFSIFYSPRGENFTVDRDWLPAKRLREIWFDPRYGTSYDVHKTSTHGPQTYTPPTSGRGQDWILIIEDADKNWKLP